ncbi:MAG TPA: hypothetical protein VNQ76_15100 [Planctomicrobium sp.]|nr:hypothetical protein [Planctomicrobium sp.]
MSRIALAAAWIAFFSMPVMQAEASWGRWWRCQTYQTPTYYTVQPTQPVTGEGPPTAPGQGTTQQNLSVEPSVVVPIAPTRTIQQDRSSRSGGVGEAQQRRLRPGTQPRW